MVYYPPTIFIDPGSTASAYVCWSPSEGFITPDNEKVMHPLWGRTEPFAKVSNQKLITIISQSKYDIVIERITLYQKADLNIHDTIWWYGRFSEAAERRPGVQSLQFMPRSEVKKQLLPGLKTSDRKDATVIAYLRDRFAPGQSNYGKGTKANPGYFYGFRADVWQAFALGVAYFDQRREYEREAVA